MARSPDVAVAGGGIIGLAVADALARRGAEVVVLERGTPGAGQSAGAARGFRHLHATASQIAEAVRARALWDGWAARAGEPLVGEEGALRLGGDVAGDAARLRAAGVRGGGDRARRRAPARARPRRGTAALGSARRRDPRRAHDRLAARRARRPRPPRGGHGRRARAARHRRRTARLRRGRPLRGRRHGAALAAGRDAPRRPPPRHVRRAGRRGDGAPSWGAATWADRSGRFGARTYGVADGPGRFALGLAELDAQPAPEDPAADAVPAGVDLDAVRARLHAYARAAFPGLGAPVDEVVRLLTVLPGDDEDAYVLDRRPGMTVVAGHNLFKLAPLHRGGGCRAIM